MSYCGQCPGGFSNHSLTFHPVLKQRLRDFAESVCLTPFEGVLVADLGFERPGPVSAPLLRGSFESGGTGDLLDRVVLKVTQAQPHARAFVVVSTRSARHPGLEGWILPTLQKVIPGTLDDRGRLEVELPIDAATPLFGRLFARPW